MSSSSPPPLRLCTQITTTQIIFYTPHRRPFRPSHTRHTLIPPPSSFPAPSSRASHVLLLFNPHAGGARSRVRRHLRVLRALLEEAAIEVTEQCSRHAAFFKDYLKELSKEEMMRFDAIVVVGGDGSLHDVVNGLMEREEGSACPPVAVVPTGTGNAVAVSMGIENVVVAALNVVHGVRMERSRKVGVLKWLGDRDGQKWLVGGVQWGFTAQVDMGTEKWRWMGDRRFELGAVKEIWNRRSWKARIVVTVHPEKDRAMWETVQEWRGKGIIQRGRKLEDNVYVMEGSFVLAVAWTCEYLGKGFMLTPFADIEESDAFDFVVVHQMTNRSDMIKVLAETKQGTSVKWLQQMSYFKATKVQFQYIEGDYLTVDGENVQVQPFTLQVPDSHHPQLDMLHEFKPEMSEMKQAIQSTTTH